MNDFRIGHIVLFSPLENEPSSKEIITFIEVDRVWFESGREGLINQCHGLPITKQSLMELGYEYSNGSWYGLNNGIEEFRIADPANPITDPLFRIIMGSTNPILRLMYLHQLQDQFKLIYNKEFLYEIERIKQMNSLG